MRRSIESLLRRIVLFERRDIAVGIPEAHQLVIQREVMRRLLLLRLGWLLFLSCVEQARKTLLLRVGNMDTLCEHVESLFDYVDRHYNHSDGSYPLAHNQVTSLYVSGAVRFPVGLRLCRRYKELTQWQACVAKH
jgi:hypothetical protein